MEQGFGAFRLRRFSVTWPSAYYSVVQQYVVGTDLPEQRLLVLMDIMGLNPAQRSECVIVIVTHPEHQPEHTA